MSEILTHIALSRKAVKALHELAQVGWDMLAKQDVPVETLADHAAVFKVVQSLNDHFPSISIVLDNPEHKDA